MVRSCMPRRALPQRWKANSSLTEENGILEEKVLFHFGGRGEWSDWTGSGGRTRKRFTAAFPDKTIPNCLLKKGLHDRRERPKREGD